MARTERDAARTAKKANKKSTKTGRKAGKRDASICSAASCKYMLTHRAFYLTQVNPHNRRKDVQRLWTLWRHFSFVDWEALTEQQRQAYALAAATHAPLELN
jgi:hypothetical protein